MDRLAGIAAAIALVAGCSGPPGPAPLAAGESASAPAIGLRHRIDAARGALGYGVSLRGNVATSVELGERFELVSRDLTAGAERELARIDLGPPDYDIDGLAVDGAAAYVASRDGTVRGYDVGAQTLLATWHAGAAATAVALSEDGAYVATGTATGVVCLRRRADGALLHCVVAHPGAIAGLDFAGEALASCAHDGSAAVWDVPSMRARARREGLGSANDVALSPDGARVAIARSAAPPVLTPELAGALRDRDPDQPDAGALIDVWTPGTDRVTTLTGHAAPVTAIAWTPDGRRLVSGAWDRSVRLWDADTGAELARSPRFDHVVRAVAIDARGARFAVASWLGRLDAPAVSIFDLLYPSN